MTSCSYLILFPNPLVFSNRYFQFDCAKRKVSVCNCSLLDYFNFGAQPLHYPECLGFPYSNHHLDFVIDPYR